MEVKVTILGIKRSDNELMVIKSYVNLINKPQFITFKNFDHPFLTKVNYNRYDVYDTHTFCEYYVSQWLNEKLAKRKLSTAEIDEVVKSLKKELEELVEKLKKIKYKNVITFEV